MGRVAGSVARTVKTPSLEGVKLPVVRQLDGDAAKGLAIACDGTRQAGPGDVACMTGRKEGALMLNLENAPPAI